MSTTWSRLRPNQGQDWYETTDQNQEKNHLQHPPDKDHNQDQDISKDKTNTKPSQAPDEY